MGNIVNWAAIAATVLLAAAAVARAEDVPLELHRGDHVCIIGNTLADRMQHHGWLETYVHALHPQHELTFRNLGFPGDEVVTRNRSDNFGGPDQWLSKCEADVVFCFFGYNEALRGLNELPKFKDDLAAMIDQMRSQQYNGASPPRLIVFSPIAHEPSTDWKGRSPHLPDGAKNNEKLEAYAAAMREVCAAKDVPFVDLFTPTRRLYEAESEPLTMNGIHLLNRGNRALAEVIVAELFPGRSIPAADSAATLREAVLDKNYHWFSRYRVVDEYNVFGGRSKLAWHGQSNADVMRIEMEAFDVMTANRDERIWAIAQGGDLEVKDDNLPQLADVKTNKPGPLEGGRFPYLGGEEAIEEMDVHQGMKVNLFASEEMFPRLVNPVQLSVDTDSRLWASVWPSYPHWNPTQPRRDALVILPDENGDGVADEMIIFADELNSVTGFEFWGGGVLVAAPPEIWFLKDTDGDDRADFKLRILQGLSSADTHHSANAMLIGPDGWLYWSRGVFNVANFETPTKTYRSKQTGVHRFNPRTFEVEFHFPIGPNPHGDVFDRWGYQFANDGTSGTGSYVNIGHGVGNKHWFEKRVRPVAATGLLSSSHFPPQNDGNFLICNVIGVLGVLQHTIHYDGADITATEIEPILTSSDQNFRPSDVEVGGDGALYIADWHNVLIGHMQHNMRDPNRDHEHGRIYRVTYPGRPLVKPAKMRWKPIEEVLQHFFAHENATRYRARLELSGRETASVADAVDAFAASLDPANASANRDEAQALLECLWVLEEHRVPNVGLVNKAFQAAEPRVRAAAIRTLGHWAGRVEGFKTAILAAARDDSPLVRAEAIKAAAEFRSPVAVEAIFVAAAGEMDPELYQALTFAERRMNIGRVIRKMIASGDELSAPARHYVLRRAPVDDLLKLPGDADVYRAILSRRRATNQQRTDAVAQLVKQTGRSSVSILLDAILAVGADHPKNLDGLRTLLINQPAAELSASRAEIERLATSAASPAIRQTAFSALASAIGTDEAFAIAAGSTVQLNDFLKATPQMDESVRRDLYRHVAPLALGLSDRAGAYAVGAAGAQRLGRAEAKSLHLAAITALSAIPNHDSEKFIAFAQIAAGGRNRSAAIDALGEIPAAAYSQPTVRPLVDNIMGFLSSLPVKRRTSKQGAAATKLVRSLAATLNKAEAQAIEERLEQLDVRVIAIGTVPHRMIYDKEQIVAAAGSTVEFRFSNADAMPHNFAITEPGALAEVGELGEATGRDEDAAARHYIPKSDKILAASRLLQPGETDSITFEAPDAPGVYPYVCTYPGHWRRMYGALYVVADFEAYSADPESYLAAHPLEVEDDLLQQNTRGREWTFDELVGDVSPLPAGRSYEVGQVLFKASTCTGCHQLGGEGHVVGPDLAKLDEKKHRTEHILRSLIEPSKEIDEKYQSQILRLFSGKTVTGLVVKETDDELHLVTDPLAKAEPTAILKDDVDEQMKSDVSQMPTGLLDKLSREEILDLIAYVYAGGDKHHKLYHDGHQHEH